MQIKSVIIGGLFTTLLVIGLGMSRLLKFQSVGDEFELQKIETLTLTPPPEPEILEEREEIEELEAPSPPAPSFADLRPNMDSMSISLPSAPPVLDLSAEVDLFSSGADPARLVAKVVKVKKSKVKISRPTPSSLKSIGLSDLDKTPHCISRGRFRWPNNVRNRQVKAVVKIELNGSGRVRYLSTVSVSDEGMRHVLPSIVNGSRFSAPTVNGKPIKIKFNWPLTLQKP
ncbi:MAG: hypothetical protein ABGY95_04600 [Rubritalea sp.]|uniref:hypothetical protein n=1 Tax=Rubritalea sp. TaxID=2109375 RepID=UPI003241C1F9